MDKNEQARRMLGYIKGAKYVPLCEVMGGFRNEHWDDIVFRSGDRRITTAHDGVLVNGEPLDYEGIDMAVVRLAHYDLDWISILFAQVWDYNEAPQRTWRFALFLNRGSNHWVPECIYAWDQRPSFAEVGVVVDYWSRA